MTRQEARILVEQEINKPSPYWPDKPELVVLDEHTREESFGWVFFYSTQAYQETGAIEHSLVGNAPIIVDKRTGELHVTGTADPLEVYVENYRRHGTPHL